MWTGGEEGESGVEREKSKATTTRITVGDVSPSSCEIVGIVVVAIPSVVVALEVEVAVGKKWGRMRGLVGKQQSCSRQLVYIKN